MDPSVGLIIVVVLLGWRLNSLMHSENVMIINISVDLVFIYNGWIIIINHIMSEDSQFSEEGGWIQWFCSLEDHFFFCEVDVDYIRDSFNLYGI